MFKRWFGSSKKKEESKSVQRPHSQMYQESRTMIQTSAGMKRQ